MATINKRGDKYRVRYDVYENGVRKQRNKTFTKAKDAKAFAAEVEHELQAGTYTNAGKLTVEASVEARLWGYIGRTLILRKRKFR